MSLQAPWHVRIMGTHGPVGAGVLVDSRRILTCAHIVAQALNLGSPLEQPDAPVTVDFPQTLDSETRSARVTSGGWFPRNPRSGTGNLALLEILGEEVRSAHSATMQPAFADTARVYAALGYPVGHDNGTWARAAITGVGGPGREWIQLACRTGSTRVQPGFGGAGLMDEQTGTVVGMIIASDRSEQDRVAWMIPIGVICAYWPPLRALVEPRQPLSAPTGTIASEVAQLTRLMLQLRGIANRDSREWYISMIETAFDHRLQVTRSDDDFIEVSWLLYTALDHPGALPQLAELLMNYHRGGAQEQLAIEISALAEGLDPVPLLDLTRRNKLYRLLSDCSEFITADMVRAAYGEIAASSGAHPIAANDVASVIRMLEAMPIDPDRLPPLPVFLEALARELPDTSARQMRDWVDDFVIAAALPRSPISAMRISAAPRRTVAAPTARPQRARSGTDTGATTADPGPELQADQRPNVSAARNAPGEPAHSQTGKPPGSPLRLALATTTLVTIHGYWSSPATWERLTRVWLADEDLRGMRIHPFGYPSPKKPALPFSVSRVPDYDDIAQTLANEYMTVLASAPKIVIVTHSQGGLILQRFLVWMANEGRARELSRIRSVIMLACPNGGAEYLAVVRRTLGYGRQAQAGNLNVLNRQVADTQRTVLRRIVNASGVDDIQCRIPFHVYAGGSDNIVPAASAQAAFPRASTIAGDHFTLLDPNAPGNRTAETVKRHVLDDIAGSDTAPGSAPVQEHR